MRVALPAVVNAAPGSADRLPILCSLVAEAAEATRADLVVLPELSACGYPELVDGRSVDALLDTVSEEVHGRSGAAFSALAAQWGCAIVFGISERSSGVRYNTLVWANPDGSLTGYRKVHLTKEERRHWTAGDSVCVVTAPFGLVGLSACNDKAFPDGYQQQRERGARMSVIASAWSSHPSTDEFPGDIWAEQSELFDRSRAAETAMVVVSTNYLGPKVPGSAERFCDGRRVVDGLGRPIEPVTSSPSFLAWDVSLQASTDAVHALHGDEFFSRV